MSEATINPEPKSDEGKLRRLADWFDEMESVHNWSGSRTVQTDLRRIADRLYKCDQLEAENAAIFGWNHKLESENVALRAALAEREPVPFAERLPPEGVDIAIRHRLGWWLAAKMVGNELRVGDWDTPIEPSGGEFVDWLLLPTVKTEAR